MGDAMGKEDRQLLGHVVPSFLSLSRGLRIGDYHLSQPCLFRWRQNELSVQRVAAVLRSIAVVRSRMRIRERQDVRRLG